jgi:hypothetical protein
MPTKKAKKNVLNFTMQPQQQFAWCWAAVGTSCAHFYDPDSTWTQCKLASASIEPSPGNCCDDPESLDCDKPWYLITPNNQGSFVTTHIPSSFVTGALPVDKLMTEIDQGRLVAFKLEITLEHALDFNIDGQEIKIPKFGHFVVIAGYEASMASPNDQNVMVYVHDPFSLDKGYSTMTYEVFQTNYKCHGGVVADANSTNGIDSVTGCRVTHSFFTSPLQNT